MEPQNFDRIVDVIGENVDRMLQLEFRCWGYAHGVVHPLYNAAREQLGSPLAMTAAKKLHSQVKRGDVVLLTTGAGNKQYMPVGETDGPLGTTALARMLSEALGAVPVILTEKEYVNNLEVTAEASGLGVRGLEDAKSTAFTTAVLPFAANEVDAKAQTKHLIDTLDPKALITIEKIGPNHKNVAHSATGVPIGDERAQIEWLVEGMQDDDRLTIGIGDNGNEIGYGKIQEAVWEHKMFGKKCQCPCEGGLATAIATDVLVVASISNWGAYGIAACLAALAHRPDLIHNKTMEQYMLEANVRSGGVDGSSFRRVLQVDATSLEIQLAYNELLRGIVEYGFKDPSTRRPYSYDEADQFVVK